MKQNLDETEKNVKSAASFKPKPQKKNSLIKKLLNLAGLTVVVVSIIFVFKEIYTTRIWEVEQRVLWIVSQIILFCSLFYGVAGLILSSAWWRILVWCNEPNATAILCHAVYGRAQIAKYLPGNIFSYVARHYLGQKVGFSHRSLAWAAIMESVGLVFSGSCLALLGVVFLKELEGTVSISSLAILIFLLLMFPFFVTKVVFRLKSISKYAIPHKRNSDLLLGLMPINLLYSIFFVVLGVILWVFIQAVSIQETNPDLILCILIMATAWIIGYVTPGASAGIGVRDALLIICLSPYIGYKESTLVSVSMRLTTIVGDVVFLGIAQFFRIPDKVVSAC